MPMARPASCTTPTKPRPKPAVAELSREAAMKGPATGIKSGRPISGSPTSIASAAEPAVIKYETPKIVKPEIVRPSPRLGLTRGWIGIGAGGGGPG